jgi:hypothetical protein
MCRVFAARRRGAGEPLSRGYDCSGSVSYALHGGGLLDRPLDSTGLMPWGERGSGRWITSYANPGHAYMVVAGLRFDTRPQAHRQPLERSGRSPEGYGSAIPRVSDRVLSAP